MGKKKRNAKQLQLRKIKGKDGESARAAEAAPSKSTNAADSKIDSSNKTDISEIVYSAEQHGRQSQSGQPDGRHRLRGKGIKPDIEAAGCLEDNNGGVKISSAYCRAQDMKDVGETAEMLSRLALENKNEDSRDRSKILGNRGLNGFTPPRARPITPPKSSSTHKPQDHITAKKGIKAPYTRSQSCIHRTEDPVQQLPVPRPSAAYLAQSSKPTSKLAAPQPLLVILDLNGTLLRRSKRRRSKRIDPRPYVAQFLAEIIGVPAKADASVPVSPSYMPSTRTSPVPFSSASSPTYSVMIWSSARPENVRSMCNQILTPQQQSRLVGVWARDRLRLSSTQYAAKLPIYKQLEWVWASNEIGRMCPEQSNALSVGRSDEGSTYKKNSGSFGKSIISDKSYIDRYWGQHNTVLLDDSALKARAEPYNIIELPEFEGLGKGMNCECPTDIAEKPKTEKCEAHNCVPVLQQVQRYLEELSYQSDVSSYIRANPLIIQKNVGNNDCS